MTTAVENITLTSIIPGDNDRTVFSQIDLEDLARSIKENGLAQPITVRVITQTPEPVYQIVAGERRFRAVKLLDRETIPAIVADLTEEEASAIMLAENTARADLDPIDQAIAYQKRMERFGWSVQIVAEKAGASSVHVQFRLKLLKLRQDIQTLVRTGNLPLGYAQILADAGLDHNRQMLAFTKLRDNPNPTPGWFRRIVGALLEEQASRSLFDTSLFTTYELQIPDTQPGSPPPHPSTTQPPAMTGTTAEIIAAQVQFWTTAAGEWEQTGKPFKKQECESAAQALQSLAQGLA